MQEGEERDGLDEADSEEDVEEDDGEEVEEAGPGMENGRQDGHAEESFLAQGVSSGGEEKERSRERKMEKDEKNKIPAISNFKRFWT